MDEVASPGTVVKLVQVRPLCAARYSAWQDHSLSIDVPPVGATVNFSCVYQPCNLLERPQVIAMDGLQQHLYTPTAHRAIQAAMTAFNEVVGASETLSELPNDPLQIADSIAMVNTASDESALLLIATCGDGPLLLPPEGVIGQESSEHGTEASPRLEGSSESQAGKPMAALAAQLLLTEILAAEGPITGPEASQQTDKEVYLLWAESLEGIKVSPSLLLAFTLLMVRREAALFLRMATGFGFAQVGDYTASLFYLFRRRGHRLKCWECGVKKKAPCGKTARDDLPWCCHRRLGEWLPRLVVTTGRTGNVLRAAGHCFLTILPPREALESEDPLPGQLSYSPRTADVVRLSDVLSDSPMHPRQALRKALHRLAPTCRVLWCKTQWISKTIEHIKAGKDSAAVSAHLWLEKTAFFKVPRCLQDETVEIKRRPFEDLVEDLLPDVDDAPILGGHNRQPRHAPPAPIGRPNPPIGRVTSSADLSKADSTRSTVFSRPFDSQDLGTSLAFLASTESVSRPLRVVSGRGFLGTSQHGSGGHQALMGNGLEASSSELASFGHFTNESSTDGSIQEERCRPWANTGQGRRRLNARAALRAAGHKDAAAEMLGTGHERSRLHASSDANRPALARLNGLATLPSITTYETSSPPPPSSASGDSDSVSIDQASVQPGLAKKCGLPCPAPVKVVIDAGGGGLSNAQAVSAATINFAPERARGVGMSPAPLGTRLPSTGGAFTRFGSINGTCRVRVPQGRVDDPDYVPKRILTQQKPSRFVRPTGFSMSRREGAEDGQLRVIDEQEVSLGQKKSWRKPRTARLQFWNRQVREVGRKRAREGDAEWPQAVGSDIFTTSRHNDVAIGGHGMHTEPAPPDTSEESREDIASPSRSAMAGSALQHLLHAVELVGKT